MERLQANYVPLRRGTELAYQRHAFAKGAMPEIRLTDVKNHQFLVVGVTNDIFSWGPTLVFGPQGRRQAGTLRPFRRYDGDRLDLPGTSFV